MRPLGRCNMKISGYKKRKLSVRDNDTKLAYDIDLSISSTTGEALFGISGHTGDVDSAANSKKVQFTFKSGRIFDPEGRCSSSYKRDESFNLKGTFLRKIYDYFIDNTLICSIGSKEDFKIRNFFFDSVGCEIDIEKLDIYSERGKIDLFKRANIPVFGSSGTSGYGAKSTSGSSGKDATITIPNALILNSGRNVVGDILSGRVIMGSGNFSFDNSSSNISYLSGVSGSSPLRDLRLTAKTELFERDYPLSIDFFTSFGAFTNIITLEGADPFNPSGIEVSINGDGATLFPKGQSYDFTNASGHVVSGEFRISYSASNMGATEKASGLPFKLYLEHISGDHSKNYSYITGIQISGSGLGYNSSFRDLSRKITFRTGDMAGVLASGYSGSLFGEQVKDKAVGLISHSTGYDTQITEGHARSIRTNLHTGTLAGSGNFNTASGIDKALFTSHENIVDIVSIFDSPDSSTAATKIRATGIPMVFSYTKPASDWNLFTGEPGSNKLTQHTATGVNDTSLMRYKYDPNDGDFLRAVVRHKNYVDDDPMVYNLVFSGADGFVSSSTISGTIMGTGYEGPSEPKL